MTLMRKSYITEVILLPEGDHPRNASIVTISLTSFVSFAQTQLHQYGNKYFLITHISVNDARIK